MIDSNEQNTPSESKTANKKAPYSRPVLQIFGELKHCTLGSGGNGKDANATHTKKSDINTKENIVRVGDHPLGIGLYLYDYKPDFQDQCGAGKQFGVLAQEVEKIMPAAVVTLDDGYKAVNYDMLGIHFPR